MKIILSHIIISIVISTILFIGINKYPLKQKNFLNLGLTPFEDVINYDNLVMQLKTRLEKEKFIQQVEFNRPKTSGEINNLLNMNKLYCCQIKVFVNMEDFTASIIEKIIYDLLDEFDEKIYKDKIKIAEKLTTSTSYYPNNPQVFPDKPLKNLFNVDLSPVMQDKTLQDGLNRISLGIVLLFNILFFGYYLKKRGLI